jgi:hypothetical protein
LYTKSKLQAADFMGDQVMVAQLVHQNAHDLAQVPIQVVSSQADKADGQGKNTLQQQQQQQQPPQHEDRQRDKVVAVWPHRYLV